MNELRESALLPIPGDPWWRKYCLHNTVCLFVVNVDDIFWILWQLYYMQYYAIIYNVLDTVRMTCRTCFF